MSGPKNSLLTDPTPYALPEVKDLPPPKPVPKSDWAKLGKSRKYPKVDEHMLAREEYWRHFLPGGEELKKLAIVDPEKAGRWAAVASCIIDEIEQIRYRIQMETQK